MSLSHTFSPLLVSIVQTFYLCVYCLGFNVIITGDRREKKNKHPNYLFIRPNQSKEICVCAAQGAKITHTRIYTQHTEAFKLCDIGLRFHEVRISYSLSFSLTFGTFQYFLDCVD